MLTKIRSAIIILILIIIAFLLQTSAFPMLFPRIVTPNFLIALTACLSLLLGCRKGLAVGLVSGLLCDIFFGNVIGYYGLVYGAIGFVCGKLGHLMYVEDIKFPGLLSAGSDAALCFFSYIFLFLLKNRMIFGYFVVHVMIPEIIGTVLFALLFYPVILRLYRRFLREVRESEKSFV